MKIAAIYNVFDGEEHLEFSIAQIRECVDKVICITQTTSNTGNYYEGGHEKAFELQRCGIVDYIFQYFPEDSPDFTPQQHESSKRNYGLRVARGAGCDYFLSIDCDEYYDKEEFRLAKYIIIADNLDATACKMYTYWSSPRLRLKEKDNYYVPFICKLNEDTRLVHPLQENVFGHHCDPTRMPNLQCKDLKAPITMHHMSWVRSSQESFIRKIENSTSHNIREPKMRAEIKRNLWNARHELYLPNYHQSLIECEDKFGIAPVVENWRDTNDKAGWINS